MDASRLRDEGMSGGGRRVLFVTREPLLQDLGGSTTYALSLLRQLAAAGCVVRIVVTLAASRSARPWFRRRAEPPAGVGFVALGYVRFGDWYVRVWSPLAWDRMVVRASARYRWLRPLGALLESVHGARLSAVAWDLSTPTEEEVILAVNAAADMKADVVVGNYAFWGPIFADEDLPAVRRVLLMHDLLSARVERMVAQGLPLDCPAITREKEMAWLRAADVVLAAQEREAEVVRGAVGGAVIVPPMVFHREGQEARASTRPVTPDRCLFVGSKILPNYDGLVWFLQQVWPLVLAAKPAARLAVCGTICTWLEERQPAYDRASVDLLHFVPSIAEEYARASLCVVPLLVGSGIKIKLIEALSYGKAVVSTPVGVQGLEEFAGEAIAVGVSAEEFAAAVLRVLAEPVERVRLERAARALVQEKFSAGSVAAREFVRAVVGDV